MNCLKHYFKIISLFYQVQHNLLLRDKKSKQQKVKQVDGVQGKCLIINPNYGAFWALSGLTLTSMFFVAGTKPKVSSLRVFSDVSSYSGVSNFVIKLTLDYSLVKVSRLHPWTCLDAQYHAWDWCCLSEISYISDIQWVRKRQLIIMDVCCVFRCFCVVPTPTGCLLLVEVRCELIRWTLMALSLALPLSIMSTVQRVFFTSTRRYTQGLSRNTLCTLVLLLGRKVGMLRNELKRPLLRRPD